MSICIALIVMQTNVPAVAKERVYQEEPTLSFAVTETSVPSETPTPAETETSTPTPIPFVFLPSINQGFTGEPIPYTTPVTSLFCNLTTQAIPDNYPAGATSIIAINDVRQIADLNISLDISHSWVGELVVRLAHLDTGKVITLIDRPGYPAADQGCSRGDIFTILDDQLTLPVENECAVYPAAISGIYTPTDPLSTFNNETILGNWALNVSDNALFSTGTLNRWCLAAGLSDSPPPPTPAPTPLALPANARVRGVTGQGQKLPLDCESRVAVDWAGFFGYQIDEVQFFSQLPISDNPDAGFVGDVNGRWGQIPPNPYGVHAEPVASLLRAYGVPAYAHRPLSWDQLRGEIAAGRPVYVWIVGSVNNGIPVYYTPSDGLPTVVAYYEHVVMVTGYSSSNVTIQDGSSTYTRSVQEFLESWSALGNMAITSNENN